MHPQFLANKDFWAGLLLIAVGTLAVAIAQDYPLGTARRMGPGYFPIGLGALLVLFGIYVLVKGLRGGGRIEAGWSLRALVVLPLALALFGFLMSRAGFVPALVVLVFASAAAGSEFKLLEIVALTVVLTALSTAVFVWGLGLPYPLVCRALGGPRGPVRQPDLRLQRRLLAAEPALLLHRRARRHADRRAAGHRPARHHRHAAADHPRGAAGRSPDHAGRHLLRRPVRRLDHGDPGQPAGRDLERGDLHRRLPDGAPGTRRPGAGDRGIRLVLRRHRRHAADRAVRPAACRVRAQVRLARIFLADADGAGRRRRAGAGRHGQVAGHGGVRAAARHRRQRRQFRRATLCVRRHRADGRHRLHRAGRRRVRHRRDHQQSRRRDGPASPGLAR